MDKKELNKLSWQIYNLPPIDTFSVTTEEDIEMYQQNIINQYSNCLEVIPSGVKAMKQADMYIEMYDKEIDKLKMKKQKAEKFQGRMKEAIKQYMKKQGTEKLEWGMEEDDLKIEIKKSEKVIIEDVNKLPEELTKTEIVPVSKVEIKKYIIEHPETEGAYIEISDYLKIRD